MELRSLNIFIEVAELKSFTRAGERLGYSQPTVSFQIKQLEQELGVQLFDRIGHTVTLTDAGREVLSYAQSICNLSHEMAVGVKERRDPRGVIRLGMADSLCEPLLAREFGTFRKKYPKVSVEITTAGTGDLFRLLDHNEVDMVCTLDNHTYNTAYVIASEEKVGVHFVAAVGNPLAGQGTLTLESLIREPLFLTEKGMSYRRLLEERLAGKSMEILPALETGRADILCQMVEQDMGISFLPDYVTEEAVRQGRIVRLDVPELQVDVWMQLLYRRDKWVSPQMRVMIEHLSGILLV